MNNMTINRPFHIFSLCVMSSMSGLFIYGYDGLSSAYLWLCAGFFALRSLCALFVGHAFVRTGADGHYQLMKSTLGTPLARIFLFLLGVLLALRVSVTLSVQADAVALYLLETTSSFAVMLVILATACFALMPGHRRIAGSAVIFTLLISAVLIIFIGFGLAGADWGELRMLSQPAGNDFSKALVPAALTAVGTECLLFFLDSDSKHSKPVKGAAAAPLVCAASLTLLVFVTVGTIGMGGFASEQFPLIEASRQINSDTIELTERFDFPLLCASLTASIIQISILTFCSAAALSSVFCTERPGRILPFLLPIIFLAAQFSGNPSVSALIQAVSGIGLTIITLLLSPVMALSALIKHRKGDAHE